METRMYLRGTTEEAKEFTINFTWRHSAAGRIGSVNVDEYKNEVTLNLLVNEDRKDDIERWAKEFNLRIMNW